VLDVRERLIFDQGAAGADDYRSVRFDGQRLASGRTARSPMPSSPRISLVAFGLVLSTLSTLSVSGCGPSQVGRPCEVGTTPLGGSSGQIVTVSSPALECPSRMCLLADGNAAVAQGTGALCTAGCESDVDCEDAETGPKNDPSDRRCENGFACMWPTSVGAFACQKMCVCRDFVGEPTGGFTKPAVCP
jgi:hypothetical protein